MQRGSTALPNFLIAGAPKTGSTSLYRYLKQHPQIYMSPVKEPCYFASEVRPENFTPGYRSLIEERNRKLRAFLDGPMSGPNPGGIVQTWDDYQALFKNVRSHSAVGEASVCYLWSPSAAGNIRARIPDARIVIILRNPVDRAFSQYVHCAANGLLRRSFREQIASGIRSRSQGFDTLYPFLEWGMYHQQVKTYLDTFPRAQVHVSLYEEVWRDPARFLRSLFEFLKVDPDFAVNLSRSEHEFRAPRSIATHYALTKFGIMPVLKALVPHRLHETVRAAFFRPRHALRVEPPERAYLRDFYRQDVTQLASLLGRDLGTWLK